MTKPNEVKGCAKNFMLTFCQMNEPLSGISGIDIKKVCDWIDSLLSSQRKELAEKVIGMKKGHGTNHPHADDLNFMTYTPCGIYNKACEDIARFLEDSNNK